MKFRQNARTGRIAPSVARVDYAVSRVEKDALAALISSEVDAAFAEITTPSYQAPALAETLATDTRSPGKRIAITNAEILALRLAAFIASGK